MFSLLTIVIAQDEDDDQFEFEDEEFDIEDIDIEGIDELEFDEGEFDELLEEFELEEEEGVYEEGTPRSFGIGLAVGSTLPFGQNTTDRFNSGMNFGLTINTPIGMYLGPFELIFGGEISFINLSAIETSGDGYSITNIMGTMTTKIIVFDVVAGVGLSPASIGEDSKTSMSVIVDASYKVPIKMDPVSIALKFRAMESLGYPGQDAGTSDLIGFGVNIGYSLGG